MENNIARRRWAAKRKCAADFDSGKVRFWDAVRALAPRAKPRLRQGLRKGWLSCRSSETRARFRASPPSSGWFQSDTCATSTNSLRAQPETEGRERKRAPDPSRDRLPCSYPRAGKLRNLRTKRVLPRPESRRRCIPRSGRGRPAELPRRPLLQPAGESRWPRATGCWVDPEPAGGESRVARRPSVTRGHHHFRPTGRIGVVEGGLDHLAQAFQGRDIPFFEGMRFPGQQFEDANHFLLSRQRYHERGHDTQCLANFSVDPRISRQVVAVQELARADTFAGKARTHFEASSKLRRGWPGAGPADHLFALPQPNGGPRCPGDGLGSLGQQLQRCLEIELCHLGERPTAVLSGKTQSIAPGFAGWRGFARFPLPRSGSLGYRNNVLVQDGGWIHLTYVEIPSRGVLFRVWLPPDTLSRSTPGRRF